MRFWSRDPHADALPEFPRAFAAASEGSRIVERVAPRRFKIAASVCALLCAGPPNVAWAQSVNLSKLTPAGADRPAPGISRPRLTAAEARLQTPKGAENKFLNVRRVNVTNGFPELEQKTRELIAEIEGKRVSVARTYEVARAVHQAYGDAGYPLVQVDLQPESLHDGVVRLDIIDGFIERIDVSKAPQDVRPLLLERLRPLLGLRHATLDEIQRRILLAGRLPGLTFNFTRRPGVHPDGEVLELVATERVVQGTSTVDNRLSRYIGTWEFWKSLRVNNVLGLGEQFYGSVASSPDIGEVWDGKAKFQFYGGGVNVPIGAQGLSATAGYLQVRSRQTPLPYAFDWLYSDAGERAPQLFERTYARLNYPFILNLRQELWLQAAYEHIDQRNRDNPDPFAILWPNGALFDLARDRYDALRLHADWGFFLPSPSDAKVMVTGEYSKGVDGRFPDSPFFGGVPLTRPDATPLFGRLNAFARSFQSLPENFLLGLFLRGQTNFGYSLPQGEQMSLDATDVAVSGFASGTINVDRGYTARSELSRPMPELQLDFGSAFPTPYVFAATGRGVVQYTYVGASKCIGVNSLGGGIRMGVNIPSLPVASSLSVEFAKDYSTNNLEYPGGYRTNFAYAVHF
jgi:hemolysin activation/secretion protein